MANKAAAVKKTPIYYDEDSNEEADSYEEKAPTKSKSTKQQYQNNYDEYDDEEGSQSANSQEEETPQSLEKALIRTINEFATFVASITHELEESEIKTHQKLKKAGKIIPPALWTDSTFKIDFTKGLLMTVFKPDRLMKYYIIFLLPMKPWITARKEKFFLKAQVFPGAPESDIKFFRDLWAIDGTMTTKEKDTIWEFWDIQIEIVEDWQKLTGWVVNHEEDLNIPNIDYKKAAKEAGLSDSE